MWRLIYNLISMSLILYSLICIAPTTFIYDNGCNLHNYCLNRAPQYFPNTWFLIDRFYWPNHTGKFNTNVSRAMYNYTCDDLPGCNIGYKMASHPQFEHINSQVVEQSNAVLTSHTSHHCNTSHTSHTRHHCNTSHTSHTTRGGHYHYRSTHI